MFRMRRCSPTFLKLTTICDVSHVISFTRPSSPLLFPTREEGLGTRLTWLNSGIWSKLVTLLSVLPLWLCELYQTLSPCVRVWLVRLGQKGVRPWPHLLRCFLLSCSFTEKPSSELHCAFSISCEDLQYFWEPLRNSSAQPILRMRSPTPMH